MFFPPSAARHPVGIQAEVLFHRVKIHGVGRRSKLAGGEAVFHFKDGFVGADKWQEQVALVVLEALLIQGKVEGGKQIRNLTSGVRMDA